MIVGIVVVALLGVGAYVFVRRSKPPEEESAFYFNCPNCRRRLKYRLHQAGHKGQCPQCKQALSFPHPAVGQKK